MRERAFQAQVRTIFERSREGWNLRGRDSQAIHSRINFEMKTHRTAASFARPGGSLLKQLELFGPHDRRRKIVFQDALFFSCPETGENKDRLANAAFAQF